MRQILITPTIIEYSKDFANTLYNSRTRKSDKKKLFKLCKLRDSLSKDKNDEKYAKYVQTIIDNYKNIIQLKPCEFNEYKERFSEIVNDCSTHTSISKTKSFSELVVNAMEYDKMRINEFPIYVQKLGIKTCVYCNEQYAVTAIQRNHKSVLNYQLDHFQPKSLYPFLCTSFFNLVPSCSFCNQHKSTREIQFKLYITKPNEQEPFHFSLDYGSLIKYMVTFDSKFLNIRLKSSDLSLVDQHSKIFKINERYEGHRDVAEEIIWKAKIYNKIYLSQLRDAFMESVYFQHVDFNRIILGTYGGCNDIHKRPLTLLQQDIAKQLGIYWSINEDK
jgi:hypothetical protein